MADGLTLPVPLTEYSQQFTGLFTCIPFKCVFEDDSIALNTIYDGGALVAVTGAALGDFVFVAPELDVADMEFYANVQAANQVQINLSNNTAGSLTTFASGAVLNGIVFSLKGPFQEIT